MPLCYSEQPALNSLLHSRLPEALVMRAQGDTDTTRRVWCNLEQPQFHNCTSPKNTARQLLRSEYSCLHSPLGGQGTTATPPSQARWVGPQPHNQGLYRPAAHCCNRTAAASAVLFKQNWLLSGSAATPPCPAGWVGPWARHTWRPAPPQ